MTAVAQISVTYPLGRPRRGYWAPAATQRPNRGAPGSTWRPTTRGLDRRLGQIDGAIEEAANAAGRQLHWRPSKACAKPHAAFVEERKREAGTLADLQAERITVAAKGRQTETEAAPIEYVAAVFGAADQETAIRSLHGFLGRLRSTMRRFLSSTARYSSSVSISPCP
jgi:hypothetical protein